MKEKGFSNKEIIGEIPASADRKSSIIAVINKIAELEENWDSLGARKPNKDAVRNAINLVNVLPEDILQCLDPEDVYPSTYGSLVLDFETEKGIVSVETGDESMGFYTDYNIRHPDYAFEGFSTDFTTGAPVSLLKYLSVLT